MAAQDSNNDINPDADAEVPNDLVVITAEVGGGTVTWTPSDHLQQHLQQAAEDGSLDEATEAITQALTQEVIGIETRVCMLSLVMTDPELRAELELELLVELVAAGAPPEFLASLVSDPGDEPAWLDDFRG